MTDDRYRCPMCGMGFKVDWPAHGSRDGYCETTRCAEPHCGRLFWHTSNNGNSGRASVGIWPDSLEPATEEERRIVRGGGEGATE